MKTKTISKINTLCRRDVLKAGHKEWQFAYGYGLYQVYDSNDKLWGKPEKTAFLTHFKYKKFKIHNSLVKSINLLKKN